MTISNIAQKTKINENSLYRWKNKRHIPNEKSLQKIIDAGVDPSRFVQPFYEKFGIELKIKK